MNGDFVSDIKKAFSEKLAEVDIFVYDEIASTNTEAKNLARLGTERTTVVIAKRQSGGRGRLGKSFESAEGGLYLSYLSFPRLSADKAVMLTVYSAVILCELIEEYTKLKPEIKWVNDVFIGEKKVAGILTEGEFDEGGGFFKYAVVGLGVNLLKVEFSDSVKDIATDIESESGNRIDIVGFAVELTRRLLEFDFSRTDEYLEKYRTRSLVVGRRVTVKSSEGDFCADALSIENDGSLLVRLDNSEIIKLRSGEVSLALK